MIALSNDRMHKGFRKNTLTLIDNRTSLSATNYMVKRTLSFALSVLLALQVQDPLKRPQDG